jgi:hypothetical protein
VRGAKWTTIVALFRGFAQAGNRIETEEAGRALQIRTPSKPTGRPVGGGGGSGGRKEGSAARSLRLQRRQQEQPPARLEEGRELAGARVSPRISESRVYVTHAGRYCARARLTINGHRM